jgi:hypothetical protein
MAAGAGLAPSLRDESRRSRSRIVAGLAWLVTIALVVVAFVLREGNRALMGTITGPEWLMELLYWNVLVPLGPPAYATVGAMIGAQRPASAVGWFSLALGFAIVVQDVAWQYATRVLELHLSDWPYPDVAALVSDATSVLFPLIAASLLGRFPNGHLPGRRWRFLTWFALVAGVLLIVSTMVSPSLSVGLRTEVANPLALAPNGRLAAVLWQVGNTLVFAVLAGAIVALGARWRRASGRERRQIKWLAYVSAVILLAGGVFVVFGVLIPNLNYVTILLGAVAIGGLSIGIPMAIAVAILRHRLYDIDAVIRRTLIYALLTVTLIGVYSGSVILLQWLFLLATGQQSDIAIVGSTAAIATLFNPVRRRIQSAIDRRFYRRSYDATRTLASFAAAARDEVDLERLAAALLEVVGETMQPATLSLWMSTALSGQRRREYDRV